MNVSDKSAVKLSVIIPSYESQATARATLESLRKQTFRDFETILIDSGPSDEVERVAADFSEVRYHRSKVRLLPHEARNVGVTLAQSDVFVFTDPDIVAAPDWLEKLMAVYDRVHGPVAGAVAGLGRDWVETGTHLVKFDLWLPRVSSCKVPTVATVNFLCTRDLLRRAGGFDGTEMIGDTILAWDLIELGETFHFAPDAVVYHDHRSSFIQMMRERFARGSDFGRLRSERENWRGSHTLRILIVSLVPVRLFKLVLRTLSSSIQAGCVFDWLKTFPVIMAGHAAWLAGESTQYWRRLQLGSAAPEPKRACM